MEKERHTRPHRQAARRGRATAPALSHSGTSVPLRVVIIGTDLIAPLARLRVSIKKVRIIGRFASVAEAVARLAKLKPEVVLLSFKVPNASASIQKIREKSPNNPVLLVADSDIPVAIDELASWGAAGLLLSPFNAHELGAACEAALQGEFILSHSAFERWMEARAGSRATLIRDKKLKEREVRTLDLLATFLQNKEIADQLGVSISLTKKILRSVFRKLGARTRAEALGIWKPAR